MPHDADRANDGLGQKAKAASRELAKLSTQEKNVCSRLWQQHWSDMLPNSSRQSAGLQAGAIQGLSRAMLDRLELNEKRISAMAKDCVKSQPCRIQSERCSMSVFGQRAETPEDFHPIGVVVIIYESRPNVTADAGASALSQATPPFSGAERKRSIPTG